MSRAKYRNAWQRAIGELRHRTRRHVKRAVEEWERASTPKRARAARRQLAVAVAELELVERVVRLLEDPL